MGMVRVRVSVGVRVWVKVKVWAVIGDRDTAKVRIRTYQQCHF